MSERMLEAIQRGLWENFSDDIKKSLEDLYLATEGDLE